MTYTLTLDSRTFSPLPTAHIVYTQLSYEQARHATRLAEYSFPFVEVMNETTGEIVFLCERGAEWYPDQETWGSALVAIESMLEETCADKLQKRTPSRRPGRAVILHKKLFYFCATFSLDICCHLWYN